MHTTAKTTKRRALAGIALLALALWAPAGRAQPTGVDPQARALLKASLDYLAKQGRFQVDTRNTLEVVLLSGQKIQFEHTARQSVQRPDRLRADRTGDLVEQSFYYDGRTLTLHVPGENYYATVDAPPTLERMLDFARSSLDIVAPAGDLVYQDAYEAMMTDVTSGFVVGKALVEGVRCDHLAFRAQHVDMQVWVEEGARPLPRKLVLTTRDVVNAPQFTVVVTRWNLKPAFTPQTFAFKPPKGAKRVDFVPAAKK